MQVIEYVICLMFMITMMIIVEIINKYIFWITFGDRIYCCKIKLKAVIKIIVRLVDII
nr:MAG TPA: hypothetical protein [Crassvirales sp.]